MKNTLIAIAFLCASSLAFAAGCIAVAKSAENDISSALGLDAATGRSYLRVYVVNSGSLQAAPTSAGPSAATVSRSVRLAEDNTVPITGKLTSATATDRPCDLIVFQNGQSQLILVGTAGTSLGNMPVAGTVSASGNPLGYNCSLVLQYTTP